MLAIFNIKETHLFPVHAFVLWLCYSSFAWLTILVNINNISATPQFIIRLKKPPL